MNQLNKYSVFLIILSLGFTQIDKKEIVNDPNKINDPAIIQWDEETKQIKDPELQQLLNELKNEFLDEKRILSADYKDRVSSLKDIYSERRKKLIKKYKKNNKKPKKRKDKAKKIDESSKEPLDKKPTSIDEKEKKSKNTTNKPVRVNNDGNKKDV